MDIRGVLRGSLHVDGFGDHRCDDLLSVAQVSAMAQPMTLREIADDLHVSLSEVRRIEQRALRKLRKMPEAKQLCLLLARFEMAVQPEEW